MENKWNLFVGDLGSSVVDSDLWNAFLQYESLVSARVVWDPQTNKSKGYGFVSFSIETDADKALVEMEKKKIKNRQIRLNWAVQRVSQKSKPSYDKTYLITPGNNSTVYIGNIPDSESIYDQLINILQEFGVVIHLKVLKGFAFAKMDSHHAATLAIVNLNGVFLDGVILKVSWGKERYSWQNVLVPQPFVIPYPVVYNNMGMQYAFPNIIPATGNMYMNGIDQTDQGNENMQSFQNYQEEKENIQ